MSTETGFCRTRGLGDVGLLNRLAWRVFVSSADGVIEDDDFLDPWKFLAKQRLNLSVVALLYCLLVCEELFFCGVVVHSEARVISVELGFLASKIMDETLMPFL